MRNIKSIISSVAITLLVTLNCANAAISTGDLYEMCKKFSEKGFKFETGDDSLCSTYVMGMVDFSALVCGMTEVDKANPDTAKARYFFGSSADVSDYRAIIQSFVNAAKTKPEEWKYTANAEVREAIVRVAPCE